ncbi:hypothetical protein ACE4V3_06190 (plasmid) [Borrelia recurrentis]|uniref:Lipoprotein n=1 Tax=Borrelia recurrentis (strain A1) TaxID=412418 RepID=B5RS45_BORRA|nr:hypothetical protein [Borrelia recurrentis]ACH95181.1 putative lipoprotein [Borrelia recurrentis A1]
MQKKFSLFNIMIVFGLIIGCSTDVQPSSVLKDQKYFGDQTLVSSDQGYLYSDLSRVDETEKLYQDIVSRGRKYFKKFKVKRENFALKKAQFDESIIIKVKKRYPLVVKCEDCIYAGLNYSEEAISDLVSILNKLLSGPIGEIMPYRNDRVACVFYLLKILQDIERFTREVVCSDDSYVSDSNLLNVHRLFISLDIINKDNMLKSKLATIKFALNIFIKKRNKFIRLIIENIKEINKQENVDEIVKLININMRSWDNNGKIFKKMYSFNTSSKSLYSLHDFIKNQTIDLNNQFIIK